MAVGRKFARGESQGGDADAAKDGGGGDGVGAADDLRGGCGDQRRGVAGGRDGEGQGREGGGSGVARNREGGSGEKRSAGGKSQIRPTIRTQQHVRGQHIRRRECARDRQDLNPGSIREGQALGGEGQYFCRSCRRQ